jgi:FkbM family methyltransferase
MKSLLVGTRLGDAAGRLRWLWGYGQRRRHPELWELYLEEHWLPVVLRRLLTPISCGVDVGSHIGSFLALLTKFAPEGRHAAFEPSPTKSRWLKRRFRDVEIFPCAVADKAGTAVFEENTALSGYSHLLAPGSLPKNGSDGASHYDVAVCRLDDVLLDRGRVDLIKIDVEGGELAALRGAETLIRKWQPAIIFECGSEYGLERKNLSRRDLFDYLTSGLGYKIFCFADFAFDKGELTFDEFRKCGLYPFRAFNFVAVPRYASSAGEMDTRHA